MGPGMQRRKVPTLNIGRSESEIHDILNHHVASVIEKQAIIGMSSPANKTVNSHLADALASAIVSVDALEKGRRGESDEEAIENFGEALAVACSSVRGPIRELGAEAMPIGDSREASAGIDSLAAAMLNVSMEDSDKEPSPVLRRKTSAAVGVKTILSPGRPRPVSMEEQELLRTTPVAQRRRPVSAIMVPAPFKTPSPAGKRTCDQATPDYTRPAVCVACSIKDTEIETLKNEVREVRHQLNQSRTALISSMSKSCNTCGRFQRKLNVSAMVVRRMQTKMDRMKKAGRSTVVKIRNEVEFNIDDMPEKRFMALFGVRKKAFNLIFERLEPVARSATYWRGSKATVEKQKPTPPEWKSRNAYLHEFLLFLMRLRLYPNMELLAFIFGWSIGKVSMVFNTWLDIFTHQLEGLIKMPDPLVCRSLSSPHITSMFPRLRCIIDCTEVFIQRPQSAGDQVATFSHYKKHNTVKVLVAILPNGFIGFLSDSWAGRASDNYIFNHSGLLDILRAGDQVLADRGFTINDELLRRGVEIAMPPGATGIAQFDTEDVVQTKRIANIRIHVERAIGRMKTYHILKGVLPVNCIPGVSKFFKAVAILVNLQDQLVH